MSSTSTSSRLVSTCVKTEGHINLRGWHLHIAVFARPWSSVASLIRRSPSVRAHVFSIAMGLDRDTKAVLDRQHTELMEHVNAMRRDLGHSNALCEKLTEDNAILKIEQNNLKLELATSRQEVATLRAELANHKRESAEAIKAAVEKAVAEHKAVIKGVRVDLDDLEQYGRRKSIRIQNVAVVAGEGEDENQDLLLDSVNKRLEHSGIILQHEDIVRFHRSSASKDDKDKPGEKVSQVIVKLRNWRLRRQFQGLNKRMREKEEALDIKTC